MTSQKEFVMGCLIGGVLGASAALLLPRFIDETETRRGHAKRQPHPKNKVTPPNSHEHTATKSSAKPKKPKSKKTSKPVQE